MAYELNKLDEIVQRIQELTGKEIANVVEFDDMDSPGKLDKALKEQAPIYAFVAHEAGKARAQHEQAKARLDEVRGQVFNRIQREEDLAIGRTERRVDADPAVIDQQNRVNQTNRRRRTLEALARALEMRRDMLIQISSRQKSEAQQY